MRGEDQCIDSDRLAAFEAEALPHMDDLFRAASRLLNDSGRAADAVQETYLIAWKAFARYQRGTNCKAWLFQILFNVARKERRQWTRWLTGSEDDVAGQDIVAPEPIACMLTDADMLAALERIPEEFRRVLLLIDVEEFSYREASSILAIPIGTVMSRLSRARNALRNQLRHVTMPVPTSPPGLGASVVT